MPPCLAVKLAALVRPWAWRLPPLSAFLYLSDSTPTYLPESHLRRPSRGEGPPGTGAVPQDPLGASAGLGADVSA